MPTLILVIAALAAIAVLFLTWGLAGRPSGNVVQQRLEQLVVQPASPVAATPAG